MPATVPAASRRARVRELAFRRSSKCVRDELRRLERFMDAWTRSAVLDVAPLGIPALAPTPRP